MPKCQNAEIQVPEELRCTTVTMLFYDDHPRLCLVNSEGNILAFFDQRNAEMLVTLSKLSLAVAEHNQSKIALVMKALEEMEAEAQLKEKPCMN